MTKKKHKNLRVFCLCGQKMQVMREMYGRPAKCVACHQKWFIPEKSEVPENTAVLYLKDHPELLRHPGQFARFLGKEAEAPSDSEDGSREIEAGNGTAAHPENGSATCERTFQQKQDKLSRQLDAEQQSTTKQLAAIEDEIARLNIALRIGDCTFETFLSKAADLRRIRETLARHNHDRQMLDNSHTCGDGETVEAEIFDGARVDIPSLTPAASHADKSLFLTYSNELREMRHRRAALARRKATWARMAAENSFPAPAVKEGLAEIEAALAQNMAHIRFCYGRMEQLLLDCDNDLKTFDAHKNVVRERVGKGHEHVAARREASQHIRRMHTDVTRMKKFIREILDTSASLEAPGPTGTLMSRFRRMLRQNALAADTALFFLAAILLIAGLLMFAETGHRGTDWLAVISTCVAIATAASGAILDTKTRGPLTAVFWPALLVSLALFLYQRATLDVYLIVLRADDYFWAPVINIRGWLLLCGAICFGAGAGVAFVNCRRRIGSQRLTGIILVLFCALFSGVVVAIAHTVAPRPTPLTFALYDDILDPMNGTSQSVTAAEATASTQGNEASDPSADSEWRSEGHSSDGDTVSINTGTGVDAYDIPPLEAEETDMALDAIMFAMHGVVHGDDAEPRFRVSLSFPDGRTENLALRLGAPILGEWTALEYNRFTKKLTISNGERLLVLQAGDSVPLHLDATKPSVVEK